MKKMVEYQSGYVVTIDNETPALPQLNVDTSIQRYVAAAAVVEKKYPADFDVEFTKAKNIKASKIT